MDELVNQLGLNLEESFSITNYVINILICSLLLFLLSFVYKKFGKSISNRSQLAKVLICNFMCSYNGLEQTQQKKLLHPELASFFPFER